MMIRAGVTELPYSAQTPPDCCVGTERDGENMEWIQIGATGSQAATEAEAASVGAEASLEQTQSRGALSPTGCPTGPPNKT